MGLEEVDDLLMEDSPKEIYLVIQRECFAKDEMTVAGGFPSKFDNQFKTQTSVSVPDNTLNGFAAGCPVASSTVHFLNFLFFFVFEKVFVNVFSV